MSMAPGVKGRHLSSLGLNQAGNFGANESVIRNLMNRSTLGQGIDTTLFGDETIGTGAKGAKGWLGKGGDFNAGDLLKKTTEGIFMKGKPGDRVLDKTMVISLGVAGMSYAEAKKEMQLLGKGDLEEDYGITESTWEGTDWSDALKDHPIYDMAEGGRVGYGIGGWLKRKLGMGQKEGRAEAHPNIVVANKDPDVMRQKLLNYFKAKMGGEEDFKDEFKDQWTHPFIQAAHGGRAGYRFGTPGKGIAGIQKIFGEEENQFSGGQEGDIGFEAAEEISEHPGTLTEGDIGESGQPLGPYQHEGAQAQDPSQLRIVLETISKLAPGIDVFRVIEVAKLMNVGIEKAIEIVKNQFGGEEIIEEETATLPDNWMERLPPKNLWPRPDVPDRWPEVEKPQLFATGGRAGLQWGSV